MNKNTGKILVVDDNQEILKALKYFLEDFFEQVVIEKNPNNLPSILKQTKFDLYILDMNFTPGESSGKEGIFWMHQIKNIDPEAIVIFITAYGDIELSVKAIKQGASDFIPKPWEDNKLLDTVLSSYKLSKTRKDSKKKPLNAPKLIIGKSKKMQKVWETIKIVSQTEANVLLLGENGTGKDLIATEIHTHSARVNKPFVKVDVGSLTESLFESELFGHKKGAFTDAYEERIGRFEEASSGTLFLDEIGNISANLQSKLLTILQNREISRIGSNHVIPIDIRLISATNKNLNDLISNNEFREDLLYRINTIQIEVPPLRERLEDLPELFNFYLKYFADFYNKPIPNVHSKIIDYLRKYAWPGNIRELKHAVEKAIILNLSNNLSIDDFVLPGQKLQQLASLNLELHEKNIIQQALNKHGGNYSKAANELGIARKTLYNKISKYGI